MRSYIKIIALTMVCLLGQSCKKYLDIVPDNVATLDYTFRNRNETEDYLFTCYSTMQHLNEVVKSPGFVYSTEIVYTNPTDFHFFEESGFNLPKGLQTASGPSLNYWDGDGGHGIPAIYQAIRRCNIMLENIDKPIDLSESEKKRWIAETKFLKAFYHYYLIRMYGPIVLIKDNNPIDASADAIKRKRSSVDEGFSYVLSLMDEAIPDLPAAIENQTLEYGRITKFIAMAFKAEIMATQASPLFNGNPDYAGFKDKDGKNLFSTTYDETLWKKAANACKEAIMECEAQGLQLYNKVPAASVGNVSDKMKEVLKLQGLITDRWEQNPELIWALNYGFPYQNFTVPRFTSAATGLASSAPSNFSVPIGTTDLYYTDNGVPINEDKTWDYSNRYNLQVAGDADASYIKSGYTTVKLHFRRERRFYANIGFDGGVWFGNGKINESDAYYIQARGPEALAGPKSLYATNATAYWPKKLANYLTVYDNVFTTADYKLPLIRLAGLYLLYAETLNEAEGPSAEVYTYIDKVRARAGLKGVQEAWSLYAKNAAKPNSKDGLRQIIHQERRIELCFEGQSGWDLRRWKELQDVLSKPVQGWNIYESNPVNFYRPQTVYQPVFSIRDYLWPISTNSIIINDNLTQNPYW
ncbi:RagB/SusD family nutrient uptake outer membrane protein [Mucilaginibacter sp. 14171R-50]|uniref:RagB/SusD family nutrient uptake outer membrane protein n=1 Tax=Mucilaginibacter sp. 14171R-50 TaxID=2703789 RepID=UPI00138B2915|nr:RagB/SusD family nutrient uptake outer membrane protein [Mucilaginibacter sp. 14171R-50]QHS56842.1 RagB/SusD family nutrient uptake outer membrane protein [Mucilaginibacter sp. 14171R-50]